MSKFELRALEYRARADAALAAGAACELAHRRALHDNAAATWIKMAETEERRALEAQKAIEAAAARTPIVALSA